MNKKEKRDLSCDIIKEKLSRLRIVYGQSSNYIKYRTSIHLKVEDEDLIREDINLFIDLIKEHKYVFLKSITPFKRGLKRFETNIRPQYVNFMNAINTPKDCKDKIQNKLAEIDDYIHKRKYRSKYLHKKKIKIKRNNILKDALYTKMNINLINIIGEY